MRWAALSLCLFAASASAAESLRIGVYLPASIADADERFQFAEALAASLSGPLGPTSARSFARYEDFAKAAESGELDLGVVDGFIAAQVRLDGEPLVLAARGDDPSSEWVIVSRKASPVVQQAGAQLAMVKGPGGSTSFLQQAVLGGELGANHFKVVPVPAVESALKMLSSKSVDAALVPEAVAPKDGFVVFRSRKVPGPIVISFKGNADAQRKALLALRVEPFTRFVPARGGEIRELRSMLRASVRNVPFIIEAPAYRLQPSSLGGAGAEPALPEFKEHIAPVPNRPDD